MSIRGDAAHDVYDVIVIGGGFSGLSAAALLARSGRQVLLVERHSQLGGYGHSFSRRRYHFDPAVRMTTGVDPNALGGGGVVHGLLTTLGVRDRCEFRELKQFYGTIFPGFRIEVPTGPGFLDAHVERFPSERDGLRRVQRLGALLARDMRRLPADTPPDELSTDDAPLYRRYRDATVAEVLDAHLSDPRLKAVLTSLWPYLGLPPSRAAFVTWAPTLTAFIESGAYHCVGGFQRLVDALAVALVEHGGEILTRSAVRRILVDRGRVTGVKLDNGQRVSAPIVVANTDPLQVCEELVGADRVDPAYLARVRTLTPSLSSAVMFLATDMDMAAQGLAHETFIFDDWDHDDTYRRVRAGEPASLVVAAPTITDPSLAPDGQHILVVMALLPYDAATSWRRSKPAYERMLLDRLERAIPGIGQRILFSEGATPRTMERYTLNHGGAIYGWENSPEQSGLNRLPHRTPVEGLYLAGHWTQPASGAPFVLTSGIQVAELVTGTRLFPSIVAEANPGTRIGNLVAASVQQLRA